MKKQLFLKNEYVIIKGKSAKWSRLHRRKGAGEESPGFTGQDAG